MASSNIAGDWTQRTHDLAVDEPEPEDSAWPVDEPEPEDSEWSNPADGLIEYSRLLDSANPFHVIPIPFQIIKTHENLKKSHRYD